MMKKITLFILVLISFTIKAQNYTPLNYSFNGTPTHGIKIKTNLPYANGSQMPTVIIEGYNYSKGKSIGIMLNWYIYQDNFHSYGASSHGAYAPGIKLANENGKVVIFLDSREYYNRFQVRAYAKGRTADDIPANYENWIAVDEALSGTNVVAVPYKKDINGNTTIKGDLNIGGETNTALRVRHINGKKADSNDFDNLYLNYGNQKDVWVGSTSSPSNLAVYGKLGIGTNSPAEKLEVNGNISLARTYKIKFLEKPGGNDRAYIRSTNGEGGDFNSLIFAVGTGNESMYLKYDGNVGIGTTSIPTNYKLAIAGKTITEEVKVQLQSNWPDYVFSKEYQLTTLQEVEQHINKKGHLQNIPSAKEVAKDGGIELGEMNRKLLEKIEELTLYTIQQEKSINELKKIVKQQSKQLESLTTKK
ncbi:hypothetical protein [Tenacibaculum sp.]|uniref:hypothetical protein n=1 Tax=Tenacibaculum sp. TaxID=1906242 RepID=UPI003AA850C0